MGLLAMNSDALLALGLRTSRIQFPCSPVHVALDCARPTVFKLHSRILSSASAA